MSKSIFNLTLDIHNPAPQCSISIKKGDSNRRIVVRLVENGRPYRLSPGSFALFCAKKPDGNTVINECILCGEGSECDGCIVSRDGCTMMGDRIVYDVTYQTTAAVGVLSAQLLVMSSDGGQIASPRFEIVIHDAIYAGAALPSSSEYSAFAALVSEFTAQKEKLTSDIEGLKTTHDSDMTELERGISDLGNTVGGFDDRITNFGELAANNYVSVQELLSDRNNLYNIKLDKSTYEREKKTMKSDIDSDIDSVELHVEELQETKLDASVYHGEIPKMKTDVEKLKTDVQTNNKTRQDQYDDLTRKIAALQALLDGEDLNLDQISEIVEYITSNRFLIDQVTTEKVSVHAIEDSLYSTAKDKVLSARAGNELYSMLVGVRNSYYALNARVPEISDGDEGKFAVVVNGAWAAVKITDVSEVAM